MIKEDGGLWCGSDYAGPFMRWGVAGNHWRETGKAYFGHPLAIMTDGTMWQCLNGAITQLAPGYAWRSVSGGYGHWCAVRSDGALYCFATEHGLVLGRGFVDGAQRRRDNDQELSPHVPRG